LEQKNGPGLYLYLDKSMPMASLCFFPVPTFTVVNYKCNALDERKNLGPTESLSESRNQKTDHNQTIAIKKTFVKISR